MLAIALLLAATFQFSLSAPTKTSAGILRTDGTLVKTLWQDQLQGPGVITGTWDETDNTGAEAAEGSYVWKVLKNTSVYTNTQTVGNTGIPTNTHGHQFFYPEGVAADADGKFLVVPDFDEPHHSFHRMNATTGHVEWESGENINANILKGVAREHDGEYAYVTAWQVQDGGFWVHTIYRVNVGNPALLHHERKVPFTVAGERIVVYGPGDFPDPDTLPDPDRQTVPLVSIANYDDKLYVTDSYAGKIWIYDEVTGSAVGSITGLPLAMGIAVDQSSGTIWVGHELNKISAFNQAGSLLGTTTLPDGTEVRQLSHIAGVLAVADRHDWVKKFSISGTTLTETDSYGIPAHPGHRDPEGVREIYGMAMNAAGEICFTDRIGNGGRSQKIDADMNPVWQAMALENTSNLTFHADNPNQKISAFRNFYNMASDTSWTFLGTGRTEGYDPKAYFGLYEVGHLGPPRIVKFGSNYYFYFLGGDGIAVYKIVPAVDAEHGPTLELASVLGGSDPNPYGRRDEPVYVQANRYLWSWNDTEGDHEVDFGSPASPGEVFMTAYEGYPSANWGFSPRSVSVDYSGNIWLVIPNKENVPTPGYDPTGDGIWVIAPQGLNSQGHPIYRWENAVKVVSRPDGIAALGALLQPGDNFGWMQAARADGRLYLLGYVQSPDNDRWWQNEGSWMAGNVVFTANETTGAITGFYVLPVQHVGLSPIPGTPGGVMMGSNRRVDTGGQPGTMQHYSKELLRLNQFFIDPQFGIDDLPVQEYPSGGLDFFLAWACRRILAMASLKSGRPITGTSA